MPKKRRFTVLPILFVAIFALWWGISVVGSSVSSSLTATANTATPVAYIATSSLVVYQSVQNGTNTYSGTLLLPSGCDTLGTGISVSGQTSMQVTVLLTLTADAQCAQTPVAASEQPFATSVTLAASSSAQFDGVTINGAIVPSSLVEDK